MLIRMSWYNWSSHCSAALWSFAHFPLSPRCTLSSASALALTPLRGSLQLFTHHSPYLLHTRSDALTALVHCRLLPRCRSFPLGRLSVAQDGRRSLSCTRCVRPDTVLHHLVFQLPPHALHIHFSQTHSAAPSLPRLTRSLPVPTHLHSTLQPQTLLSGSLHRRLHSTTADC